MLDKTRILKFSHQLPEPGQKRKSSGFTRFDDYLFNEKQSYFSRDEYRAQNPGAINLPTESEILEKLLHQFQYNGLIICGESGSGRTRLMMELAAKAEQEQWKAIIISSPLQSLDDLNDWLHPGDNHLLIFLNLRENPLFKPGLTDQLNEIYPEARVKVMGACWKTFLTASPLWDSEEFLKIDISPNTNPIEHHYKTDVIKKILAPLPPLLKNINEDYDLKPVHAVFLKFLHENFGTGKEKPTGKPTEKPSPREADSFRHWLIKRLCLTFGLAHEDEIKKQKERLNLFCLLPSTGEQTTRLYSTRGDDLRVLKNHGWLEDDETLHGTGEYKNELNVVHVAIAEDILRLRLEESGDSSETEITDIFAFAATHNALVNCFKLFERISSYFADPETFTPQEIKRHSRIFSNLLSQYIVQPTGACMPLKELLTVTPLMDDESIIMLLAEYWAFFKESLQSPGFGMKLASKMRNLAKSEYDPGIKEKVNMLLILWLGSNRDFIRDKCLSSQLLAAFILFFGVDSPFGEKGAPVETIVQEWLTQFPGEKETQLIMIAWLDAGGKHYVIEPYFKQWLENYPLEKETSLIIKAWLDSGGKDTIIKECLTSWLNEFPEELDTHFVIKSWLDTVGDKDVIKTYLDVWLKKFPLEMETSLVIQSWLTARGDREIVREFIKPWLNKFPEVIETSFVITSWLEAGGEKQLIEDYLRKWLKKFPEVIEASFVIQTWLDAGGEKQIIAEYLKQWLKRFPGVNEASFVIKAWLGAGGDKQLVEEYLKKWLTRHSGKFETRFVLCSWLDAGGDKQLVRENLKPWLKKFPLEKGTSFVIKAWLDAKGEKRLIEEYIKPWLAKYPLEMEASFVFQAWLEAGGDKHLIREYIKPWLTKFPLAIESSFVIKSWLAADGNKEIVREFIGPWLAKFPLEEKDTSFVIRAWLNADGEPGEVRPFVLQWLEKYHTSFEASYVIKAWLKNTRDADSIKMYALKWLRVFQDHPKADYVIKRFCYYEDIPADVLDAAIHWYKKYIDTGEALYTLLYLTRHQITNERIAAQWLLDDLANRSKQPVSSQEDIKNLEYIMYDMSRNKDFCYSPPGVELSITWFLSEHSFHPVTLQKNSHFLQQWWYFERYSRLLLDRRIDIIVHKEKVEKFLRWVNGWHPNNKTKIQRNLQKLMKAFPQHRRLWEKVHI